MKEEKTKSLEDLYQRLLPAFRVKKGEMDRMKMPNVKERDLWKYFCKKVWSGKQSLSLGEMVNDILNTDSFTIYMDRKDESYGTNHSQQTE